MLENYFEIELSSENRHEYIDGQIVPMPINTPSHNLIAGNLASALNLTLKRQPYRVFLLDQRLWIPQLQMYAYPDVMVVEGVLQLQEGRQDTITNPLLIAEVLSEDGYDKDKKFRAYRTIPTLREYVLIHQDSAYVERYYKANREWAGIIYSDMDITLSLSSVPLEIGMGEVYDKAEF